jgi:hypothetical protein
MGVGDGVTLGDGLGLGLGLGEGVGLGLAGGFRTFLVFVIWKMRRWA